MAISRPTDGSGDLTEDVPALIANLDFEVLTFVDGRTGKEHAYHLVPCQNSERPADDLLDGIVDGKWVVHDVPLGNEKIVGGRTGRNTMRLFPFDS